MSKKKDNRGPKINGSFFDEKKDLGDSLLDAEAAVECKACIGRACCPYPHTYWNYVDEEGVKYKLNSWMNYDTKAIVVGTDAELKIYADSLL